MELFAQAGRNPPPPDADAVVGILLFYGVVLVVVLVIQVLFLLSLSKCFQQISPRNRQMEPGLVWLNLIPVFQLVWLIITIIRLSDSLRDEYYDRRLRGDGDFGKTMGIIFFVTWLLCGPLALIFLIIYWVKVAGYTRQLATSDRGGDYGDYDEDDEDDRPRRRRRPRDEDDRDDEDDRPERPWSRGNR